jgi:uncharacterized protein (TIGR02145 family)
MNAIRRYLVTTLMFVITINTSSTIAQCSEYFGLLTQGGDYKIGAIFRTDGNGADFQIVYSFKDKAGGTYPEGKLCLGPGGKYYGITRSGGEFDDGVIFEWDPVSNIVTKKADFNRTENGSNPQRYMIPEDNGKFIGLANGGINDNGIIYEWDPVTNEILKKFEFNDTLYQNSSSRNLIKANNGKFYGYKNFGSMFFEELFEWDPASNAYTKRVHFSLRYGYRQPCGSLMQADNGKLYGITSGLGDSADYIFELDPVTNRFSKKAYINVPYHRPCSNIIQAENGKIYGLLEGSYGIVFEWDTNSDTIIQKFRSSELGIINIGHRAYDMIKGNNGKILGYYDRSFEDPDYVIYKWDPVAINLNIKKINGIPTGVLTENRSASSCTTVSACHSFLSPSGKYLWTRSGIFRDTLQNYTGNDSVITVNLNITHVDASVENFDGSLIADNPDANYQWLDCNDSYRPIAGERGYFFTPSKAGSYALKITKNGCTDTSKCIPASCQNTCINLSDGLVANYPFKGNTNDESGNKHHGTDHGAVFVYDRFGNPNQACEMSGEPNNLSFAGTELPVPDLTISAWFKIRDTNYDTVLFLNNRILGMCLRVVDRKFQAELIVNDRSIILADHEGIFEIDPEHPQFDLLILSYNGSEVTLQINNRVVDSQSLEASSLPFTFPATLKNDIRFSLRGVVDDIRIYNRMLNSREIDALNNERVISAPLLSTDSVSDEGRYSASVFITVDHNVIPLSNKLGFLLSTSPDPDLASCSSFISNEPMNTGKHQYRIRVYGLVPNTRYHIWSFTTGNSGINLGNELIFKTLMPFNFGSVTDVEGNIYKTVSINNRNWMAENLKTTKYDDGSPIPHVKGYEWSNVTSGAYCWYDNDDANKNKYGALYNYFTVTDNHKLCPSGWHIPTPAEWASLPYSYDCETYLMRTVNCHGCSLRAAGSQDWKFSTGTDETGFSALPGGKRRANSQWEFQEDHVRSYFWESNGNPFTLSYNGDESYGSASYNNGYSVRCIEDQEVNIFTPEQDIVGNSVFDIPVYAVGLPQGEVLSYRFDLNYINENLRYQGFTTKGTLSSAGNITGIPSETGLSVAWVGQIPLADSGILIKLRFRALESGTFTPTLSNFVVNEDTVRNIKNGTILVDIDTTGQVLPTESQKVTKKTIEIYPNPVNTILYFRNLKGATSVIIFDLQGRKVLEKAVANDQIDVSNLPEGFYTIRISDKKIVMNKKLIRH